MSFRLYTVPACWLTDGMALIPTGVYGRSQHSCQYFCFIALTHHPDQFPCPQSNLSCYNKFSVLCYPYRVVFDIICVIGRFPVIFHIHHLKFSILFLPGSKTCSDGIDLKVSL